MTAISCFFPPVLQRFAQSRLNLIASSLTVTQLSQLPEDRQQAWARALVLSDFLIEKIQQHPDWLPFLLDIEPNALARTDFTAIVSAALGHLREDSRYQRRLRLLRHRWQCAMILADVHPSGSFPSTTRALSNFADACIVHVRERIHHQQLQLLHDDYLRELLHPHPLIVFALGKLGGHELNLRSDVDLIFCRPYFGVTETQIVQIERFYLRTAHTLIAMLDAVTVQGVALCVDLRLRPYGTSGALVWEERAFLRYYREQGREWERYAMIRVRQVGHSVVGQRLLDQLSDFVYRPFRDYRSLRTIREMRQMMLRDRKITADHIKRGAGGIRNAEFILQTLQLLNGGRYASLQCTAFTAALTQLTAHRLIDSKHRDHLAKSYAFLRDLEHRLQAIGDRPIHAIPQDTLLRERIAYAMGCQSWSACALQLRSVRARIVKLMGIYLEPTQQHASAHDQQCAWEQWLNDGRLSATALPEWALQSEDCTTRLQNLFRRVRKYTQNHALLVRVMIRALAFTEMCEADFIHLLDLLISIARRANYLALLDEYPQALLHTLRLMRVSDWLAEQIVTHPLVLENFALAARGHPENIDFQFLQQHYHQYLAQLLNDIPHPDGELQMDTLRRFKHHSLMYVAGLDTIKHLPLMKISDHLTAIADALIRHASVLAWKQVTERYGLPIDAQGAVCSFDTLTVLGYGKLGGIEMGYQSDCDVILLYTAPSGGHTTGERAISNQQFYLRLAQRIIHLLNSYTTAGRVYVIDLRLRPEGKPGLLITPFAEYARYLRDQAWIFEHQALTRTRIVQASAQQVADFCQVRCKMLCQARDPAVLREEILNMRRRMAHHKGARNSAMFDLKNSPGGIVDIEFIVQYLLLRDAHQYPALIEHSDNMRQLDALIAHQCLEMTQGKTLQAAYLALRQRLHQCNLRNVEARVPQEEIQSLSVPVRAIWESVLEVDASWWELLKKSAGS